MMMNISFIRLFYPCEFFSFPPLVIEQKKIGYAAQVRSGRQIDIRKVSDQGRV